MNETLPREKPKRAGGGAAWLALAVVLLTVAAFLPSLQNGFVSWDDDANFLTNPHYRGLGWANLRWLWTPCHHGHYVPMT